MFVHPFFYSDFLYQVILHENHSAFVRFGAIWGQGFARSDQQLKGFFVRVNLANHPEHQDEVVLVLEFKVLHRGVVQVTQLGAASFRFFQVVWVNIL